MTPRQLRLAALEAIHKAGNGHPGGVLSCVEILHTLYTVTMRHDPANPAWRERDRFVMSKGHASAALYVVLSEAGYFHAEELDKVNRGGMLGEHPNRRIPGIDANTGSLGHGLGIACGMALAAKLNGATYRTFVLLSDGECWEGSVWEAALFAAHHELNITAIIDRNGFSIRGDTESITRLAPLADKWAAFGWDTFQCDGHDVDLLAPRLALSGRPVCLIANTVKGKGVSFMEGDPNWHNGRITDAQMALIRSELS